MIIDVRAIPEGRSSRELTVSKFSGDVEWPQLAGGLECRCQFDRTPWEIVISVSFAGRAQLSCARCLEPFELPVTGVCTALARPESARRPDEAEADVDLYFYDDDRQEVDIGQTLFDELVTSLPMKPLCSEQCPGVQPAAGAAGERHDTTPDPRWEALRALRKAGAGQRRGRTKDTRR